MGFAAIVQMSGVPQCVGFLNWIMGDVVVCVRGAEACFDQMGVVMVCVRGAEACFDQI